MRYVSVKKSQQLTDHLLTEFKDYVQTIPHFGTFSLNFCDSQGQADKQRLQ